MSLRKAQMQVAIPADQGMHVSRYFSEMGPTTKRDLDRLVWLGPCGYWTDDWSKLKQVHPSFPAPGCPLCGAPGFQTTYRKFRSKDFPKEWCVKTLGEPDSGMTKEPNDQPR